MSDNQILEYKTKDLKRFWVKVNKNGSTPEHCPELGQCWEWIACFKHLSYGNFFHDYKNKFTHRVSWEIHNGYIPYGMEVCHKCDNQSCVNPYHLFLGTHQDNMDDRSRKGRLVLTNPPRGERHGKHKLTASQVGEIRSLYTKGPITHQELANRFDVSKGTIGFIVRGETWKGIADERQD